MVFNSCSGDIDRLNYFSLAVYSMIKECLRIYFYTFIPLYLYTFRQPSSQLNLAAKRCNEKTGRLKMKNENSEKV